MLRDIKDVRKKLGADNPDSIKLVEDFKQLVKIKDRREHNTKAREIRDSLNTVLGRNDRVNFDFTLGSGDS